MTNQHPIAPPLELIQQWWEGTHGAYYEFEAITVQAAQWGADQELKACVEWLDKNLPGYDASQGALQSVRRPKPPSLKEEALKALRALDHRVTQVAWTHADTIRRALEALPDD